MADNNQGKNKSRSRWSAADTFIVLLVVLSVGGFAFRFIFAGWQAERTDSTTLYDLTFTIENVSPDTVGRIRAADIVYMYGGTDSLGYIDSVTDEENGRIRAAIDILGDITGEPRERVNAVGTMVCTGARLVDGFLMVDGCPQCLAPGNEITVCTERVLFTLKVTGIKARE